MSYPLPGVDPVSLENERQIFLMTALHGVGFGIHCCVFATTLYFIHKASLSKKTARGLTAYVFALFALGVIELASTVRFNMLAFVANAGFPGGPYAWFQTYYSIAVDTLGDTAYVTAALLADAALLYRVKIIWGNNWFVLILPSLAYIAEFVLSILAIFESAQPGASLWVKSAVNILIPYWSLGIANNMFMTLLIVYRMLSMRSKLVRVLGADSMKVYVSISAMLIESAALYSITGIVFIILFARNSPVQNSFLAILDQVVCIAPELIIMRVVLGRAWSSQITSMVTTTSSGSIKFNKSDNPISGIQVNSATLIAQQSDRSLSESFKMSEAGDNTDKV